MFRRIQFSLIRIFKSTLNQVFLPPTIVFRRTALESEEIVAELVHSFLIPEVRKKTQREKSELLNTITKLTVSHLVINSSFDLTLF